jgi:hypothetical protein
VTTPDWLTRVLGGLPRAVRPATGVQARLTPLTRERVADYLRSRGNKFVVDDDGDLTGTWNGDRFWFLLLGDQHEILQVRGRWHRTVPMDNGPALALAINDWNRDRIWPKVYAREEDGELGLYTEVSADLEPGVNDAQLGQIVSCGLGTGVQAFAAMSEALPDPDDHPDN